MLAFPQVISVEEALRVYMLRGAYAWFDEHKNGSIEPVKPADLFLLGADSTQVDPMTIKDIPVEMTFVGGEVVSVG